MKAFTCSPGCVRRKTTPAAVLRQCGAICAVRVRLPSIASLAALGMSALLWFAAAMAMAGAEPQEGEGGLPPVFETTACYQLVQETGRMIAWARWEVGAPEDKVVAYFDEDTPEWVVDLTNRWIADAYHWEITDEWAGELGEATASSRAEGLTTPETITIWLRRIARQCREQHA